MNKRIRELAEQAGIVFWEMSGDVDWRQANREHLEEFAELIVRECAQFVEDKFDFIGDEIIVKEKILEHFGVEE